MFRFTKIARISRAPRLTASSRVNVRNFSVSRVARAEFNFNPKSEYDQSLTDLPEHADIHPLGWGPDIDPHVDKWHALGMLSGVLGLLGLVLFGFWLSDPESRRPAAPREFPYNNLEEEFGGKNSKSPNY